MRIPIYFLVYQAHRIVLKVLCDPLQTEKKVGNSDEEIGVEIDVYLFVYGCGREFIRVHVYMCRS